MDGQGTETTKMKFCKHCGAQIAEDAVICTVCGRQVEEMKSANAPQPTIVINNENTNTNTNLNAAPQKSPKNKWAALALCFFLGIFGAHKFYEQALNLCLGRCCWRYFYLFQICDERKAPDIKDPALF